VVYHQAARISEQVQHASIRYIGRKESLDI